MTKTMSKDNYEINMGMQVVDLPMNKILSDSKFNIRGEIRMPDIMDLARNISTHGLLQPITVQPRKIEINGVWYDFRIVLGHRRHAAHLYLQRDTIPAIIKDGLTDVQALALNFNENVNRKDLNILEEAYGIQRFLDAGESIESTAKMINKGKQWVTIRKHLLTYPDAIKEDAAAGWITQSQILDLSTVSNPKEQLDIVRKIKEAKGRGERRLPKVVEKKTNPMLRKRRNPAEIMDMIDYVIDESGVTSPFTLTMAWCNGDINDLELYRAMIEYFKAIDIPFNAPLEVQHLLPIIKTPDAK